MGRDVKERVPKHVPEASALGIAVKGGETDHFVAVANDFDVGRAEPENEEEAKQAALDDALSDYDPDAESSDDDDDDESIVDSGDEADDESD